MITWIMHIQNLYSRQTLGFTLIGLCLMLSACAPSQTSPDLSPPPLPTANVEAALKAYKEGDCQESIRQFQEALTLSRQTSIYNGLGMAYLLCNQAQSAIPVFEKAIDQSPGSAALHTNLGTAFYDNFEINSAKKEFQAALKLDPMYVGASVGMASIYIYEDNPELALRTLFELEKINPHMLEVNYNKAIAYHSMGLSVDAEELLLSYIKDNPGDAEAHNAMGVIFLENEKLVEAREHLDTAIKLYPVDGRYYYNRGNIYRAENKFKEAKDDYTRALAFLPDMAEAYVNRGDLRFLLREVDGACADLKKACSLSSDLCVRLKSYQATGRCPAGL